VTIRVTCALWTGEPETKGFIQTVKTIAPAASACGQPSDAIQRTVNSTIIGEVEQFRTVRHQEIHGMLVGMDFGNIATSRKVLIPPPEQFREAFVIVHL